MVDRTPNVFDGNKCVILFTFALRFNVSWKLRPYKTFMPPLGTLGLRRQRFVGSLLNWCNFSKWVVQPLRGPTYLFLRKTADFTENARNWFKYHGSLFVGLLLLEPRTKFTCIDEIIVQLTYLFISFDLWIEKIECGSIRMFYKKVPRMVT